MEPLAPGGTFENATNEQRSSGTASATVREAEGFEPSARD
jgi:hypothetical protein